LNQQQSCASDDPTQFSESPEAGDPLRSPGAPPGAPAKRSAEGASDCSETPFRGNDATHPTHLNRPTHGRDGSLDELRERALEVVRERRCFSKTELASYVRGGNGEVLKAIDSLLEDGTLKVFIDGSFTEVSPPWI